ncbi:MAG: PPOX class F420-dependent oxidoreductase [Actinomycetota bacterium]
MASKEVPESHVDLLEKAGIAHISTLGPKGEPQVSPVWYDWDGTYVLVSHTKERQKYRNVTRDPRVALSITDPENPYRYVEIRGPVEEVQDDPEKVLIHKLAKKYLDKDRYPYDSENDNRVIFKIRPSHVNASG